MDKNIKICIIGGGPAGLSAGMYLEQKGYENYTILEKNDRVGGKCWSPYYNGRRYEMGAIMGVPSYYAVHDVEEFCGITHDGPQLNRNYKNRLGQVIEPFEPKKNITKIPRLLKMKKQLKKFGELLETKYKGYDINGHRGVAEGRYEGFSAASAKREPVSGVNPNLKDLALPFKKFCEINGVELVQDIWIGPFTSFGYGYFDEIPAAYVLKYLDFQTCMNFVKINLWTWKDGTQFIWESLNEHLKNPARLNSCISSVERHDGKVYVKINDYEALRNLFADLLAEVQRIKSEGDYTSAHDLVENYAVKVDKDIHEEILSRYEQLNLSPYKGFINPVLTPSFDEMGNITDINIDYSEKYDEQMLRYSRDYSTLI